MKKIATTLTADEMQLVEDFREDAPFRKHQKRAIDKGLAEFLAKHPGWKVVTTEWTNFWEAELSHGGVRIYTSKSGVWYCATVSDDQQTMFADFSGSGKTPCLALAAAVRGLAERMDYLNSLLKDAQ